MTKKIKFLEDCIFQRDLIYKKDKLYAIKSEDSTHYIIPDEFGNENELSKVRSIFEYEIIEEPKVTKYIKITKFSKTSFAKEWQEGITFNKWYEIYCENSRKFFFRNDFNSERGLDKDCSFYQISEGHPHKHLIKKAAELAEDTMDIGSHFQYKNIEGVWTDCRILPSFHIDTELRLKPRTIKIGNREINAPEQEPLQDGQAYYSPCVNNPDTHVWKDKYSDNIRLKSGLVFLTWEDAIAATEAMIELLRGDA